MRAGITMGYVVGAHSAFYRAEEEGSGLEVGSQEASGSKCDFNGACVMVPKRNREEGKRGVAEVIGWRLFEGVDGVLHLASPSPLVGYGAWLEVMLVVPVVDH
jgi:hypothetical protein